MHSTQTLYDELNRTFIEANRALQEHDDSSPEGTRLILAKAECLNGMALLKTGAKK